MSVIPNDPVTGIPLTYAVNERRSKAEILGFLENAENVSQASPFRNKAYAGNFTGYPFTRGDTLGIVLSNTGGNTNTPIQLILTGSFEIGGSASLSGYVAYQASKTILSDAGISGLGTSYVPVNPASVAALRWATQTKVTASDKAAGDYFGYSVSLSLDGNTAIIGTRFADPGGTTDAGAAYIYIKSGGTWSEQAKLTASDKAANDWFGLFVSISSDGNTAIVGAIAADPGGTTNAGAAYVFTRSGGTWSQQSKLTASDKAAGDYFGYSVSPSSDGNTAIVGAYQADPGGTTNAGAAYVFTRSGGTWTEQAKLTASDKAGSNFFGSSVFLSSDGNTVIVGATAADPGGTTNAGAAYVFIRSGGTWSQQAKLTASDKAGDDYFGSSVSLSSDGNTAIVGATAADPGGTADAGAAYVFTRSGGTWSEQAKLTASDKAANDDFGRSVSFSSDGNTVIVGASSSDPGGTTEAGAAYVFVRSGGTWAQQSKLTAFDKAGSNFFGSSVSLSSDGNTAIVGAYQADPGGTTDAGAVYIFQ
jgi:hypothetical protein